MWKYPVMADIVRYCTNCPRFSIKKKDICPIFNPSAAVEMDNIGIHITIKPYACSHVEISARSKEAPNSYYVIQMNKI